MPRTDDSTPSIILPALQEGLTEVSSCSSSRASYDLDRRRNSDVFDELHIDDYRRIHWASCEELEASHPSAHAFIRKRGFSDATPAAIDAMVDYLRASATSAQDLLMPSEMTDTMWKGFVEREPRLYKEFCEKFIGKVIERNEMTNFKAAFGKPDFEDRLCAAWVALYRQTDAAPSISLAPALFNADVRSQMTEGRGFWQKDGLVHTVQMSPKGFATGERVDFPGVNLERMHALGLVTGDELSQAQKMHSDAQALKEKQASEGKFKSILRALTGPGTSDEEKKLYGAKTPRHGFIGS